MPVDYPKSRTARLLTLLAVTTTLVVPATPAFAAQGSVPSEVSGYAGDPDGLIARLDDLFGETAANHGIDFRGSAQPGPITRVWSFTAGFLGGADQDSPVQMANLWTVPILVGAGPVGLATIWIDPGNGAPDVADFVASRSVASMLSDVPEDAQLVYDKPRGAWFALRGRDLVVLVPGASGVTGSTTLAQYQALIGQAPPAPVADASGLIGGGVLIGAAAIGLALMQVIPRLRRRRDEPEAVQRPVER